MRTDDTLIAGDNMDTDIIAGIQSGLETILVLTGVSRREDLSHYPYRPHHIVEDAPALMALLDKLAGRGTEEPGPATR